RRVTAELTVGIVSSDRLFPPADGQLVASSPACRELAVIDSPYGHDAFLVETDQVFAIIRRALTSAPVPQGNRPPAPARSPGAPRPTHHRGEQTVAAPSPVGVSAGPALW